MTVIESSFFQGQEDQMQQWLDCGVLENLMHGRTRSNRNYHDVLPARLLQGASRCVVDGGPGIGLEDCGKWWGILMSLRNSPKPRPSGDWAAWAAALPLDLAKDWVEQGSNPHVNASLLRSSRTTPFLALLQSTIRLNLPVHRWRAPGWPSRKKLLENCKHRLLSWSSIPGMQPEDADRALVALTRHAVDYPKTASRDDAWLSLLRDRVIAQGGACTDEVMKDILLPALAPRKPASRHASSSAALNKLEYARQERETQRLSPAHQSIVSKWLGVLIDTPARENRSKWREEPAVVFHLLRAGCVDVAKKMLESCPGLFHSTTPSSQYRSEILLPKDQYNEAALVATLVGLSAIKDHPQAPSRDWILFALRDAPRLVDLGVESANACLDLCVDQESRDSLAGSWMYACINSRRPAEDFAPVLGILHDRGALGVLPRSPGNEEGSSEDLANVRNSSGLLGWLMEDRLAQLLRSLPDPVGPRATRLSLFFADDTLSVDGLESLFSTALANAPNLLVPAVLYHLDRLDRQPSNARAIRSMAAIKALAHLGMPLPVEAVPVIWEAYGQAFSPRADENYAVSAICEVARDLARIAPPELSQGQPLCKMHSMQVAQEAQGLLSREPLRLLWPALDPLIVELVKGGLDLDRVKQIDPSTPLGHIVMSHQQRQSLDSSSPAPSLRAPRRF